jgi:hypothetical protein
MTRRVEMSTEKAQPDERAQEFVDWWNSNWPDLAPTHIAYQSYLFGQARARAGSSLMPERSDADYAIEHGEYLATAAENFLAELYRFQKKESEDGCDVADSDSLNDHAHALRDGIYEFRKRAKRCVTDPTAPPKELKCTDKS